ncbi:hypothetical protein BdWA1_003196 [Babesia duncani]|uniref:Uncharacterized protein n=1 Tax=Babesia duncani TaxID=323732 RepID=A0AAD9UN71_9APIC|nr:hypothetical protein BdWA1_003196 [Babesia duncani]
MGMALLASFIPIDSKMHFYPVGKIGSSGLANVLLNRFANVVLFAKSIAMSIYKRRQVRVDGEMILRIKQHLRIEHI